MKYTINLVRQIRQQEKKAEKSASRTFAVGALCMGVLAIAVLVWIFQILGMENKITSERQDLNRIELEYSKYRATKMVVDKADLERLDSLQSHRIFWTKKLAALAYHLPENYWITQFNFEGQNLTVSGYGYISMQQEQLITIDDYLNKLRGDTTFNDIFRQTGLNSISRSDEQNRTRVSFEYLSRRSQ